MTVLDGYKTYIVAALGALAWGLTNLGYLTPEQFQNALTILGIGAVAGFRSALAKG